MNVSDYTFFLVLLITITMGIRPPSQEDYHRLGYKRDLHYHTKRHMLLSGKDPIKRPTTQKPRDIKKKPSGHLRPLDEDDMENDEFVSVVVGPPPIKPKFDKQLWKYTPKHIINSPSNTSTVTYLIKDVLTQLGREMLTRELSEDFVFGQYIGDAMKILKKDLKLKMQHEILELLMKYQLLNRNDKKFDVVKTEKQPLMDTKELKYERKSLTNDTEENWPDFSNIEKIVERL